MNYRRCCCLVMGVGLLVSCQASATPGPQARITPAASVMTSTPMPGSDRAWRKDRYITAEEAVARLQPHVDVPVVLPRMKVAYLPQLERWLADPKYTSWSEVDGVRYGTMKLLHRNKLLILDFGRVSFDGCGGTDFAVPTKVGDQPALLYVTARGTWSQIVWPMRPLDSTGTYGLAGTLEAWQAYRLALSMEGERINLPQGEQGC